jgi:hypothetical protein
MCGTCDGTGLVCQSCHTSAEGCECVTDGRHGLCPDCDGNGYTESSPDVVIVVHDPEMYYPEAVALLLCSEPGCDYVIDTNERLPDGNVLETCEAGHEHLRPYEDEQLTAVGIGGPGKIEDWTDLQ